jgi:phage tail-like protein
VNSELSSYIRYLPPALWSHEGDPSRFLGRYLRIFEKILIGIPDDVPIQDGDQEHEPLEKIIDELAHLFDPWRTPRSFLPWLASWVALTLPEEWSNVPGPIRAELSTQARWSEYQQRKLISEMVSIYRQRGLKRGLHTYLDLYAVSQARPRIAIDDGEALLRAILLENGTVRLHAIAYSHTISIQAPGRRSASTMAVLLHPTAVAVDRQNNYIVVDEGGGENKQWQPALWKVSSTGEIGYTSAETPVPLPHPIHSGAPLEKPTAVIIGDQDQYNILDVGKRTSPADYQDAAIYRLTPPAYDVSTVIEKEAFQAVHPVDMVLDTRRGFIVLDRGRHPRGYPPQGPSKPKIVVVPEEPPVEVHPLETIVTEPTALIMDHEGCFIIADARDQRTSNPADLIRVDPENDWQAVSLLEQVDQNPLIFPTGLVFERPESLLVCDTGLRWGYKPDQSNRVMAEPAALYRVDLSKTPPTITQMTSERTLVNPSKMAMDRKGVLVLADRGEALRLRSTVKREWRARTNEFGMVVHFSQQRSTNTNDRNRIRRGIEAIIEEQRPGHSSWWMEY